MPCNAVATIRTKLALPQSIDGAIKELSLKQAEALYTMLLKEITNQQVDRSTYFGSGRVILQAGGLAITIKHKGDGKIIGAELEPTAYPNDYKNALDQFNAQTIRAAGLIKQARAIQTIKARFLGAEQLNAPNGATIINLDI